MKSQRQSTRRVFLSSHRQHLATTESERLPPTPPPPLSSAHAHPPVVFIPFEMARFIPALRAVSQGCHSGSSFLSTKGVKRKQEKKKERKKNTFQAQSFTFTFQITQTGVYNLPSFSNVSSHPRNTPPPALAPPSRSPFLTGIRGHNSGTDAGRRRPAECAPANLLIPASQGRINTLKCRLLIKNKHI